MAEIKDFTVYKKEKVDMLIRFYNFCCGTSYKFSNLETREKVVNALDCCDDNITEIKDFVREYANGKPETPADCFQKFYDSKRSFAVQVEKVEQEEKEVTDKEVGYSMGLLEKAVVKLIADMNAKKIEEEVMSSVEQKVKDFIKEEYGAIDRKVNTYVDGRKVEMDGVQHEMFETVLKFVANNEPVFLTGAAGCGKNVLCQQVAKALGLKFYFTNAVTQEYKLTGFTDAMGTYHATQFYQAFKNGGLFMLDEIDASIPEVLIILNAAIANRYFDFPAPIGYVEAHPDFRVIAAGNTFGYGADFEYVGRNQLDAASLDRFALVRMDYSKAIETAVAFGDNALVDFCEQYRKSAEKNGIKVIVSYRAIGRLAKMMSALGQEEAMRTCLIKGLGKDDVRMISNGIDNGNKYKTVLLNVINAMEEN